MTALTLRQAAYLTRQLLADREERAVQQIKRTADFQHTINGVDGKKIYVPSPTGLTFHHDNSFVKGMIGAYGSGKTTTMINEVVAQACSVPAWNNGRRRSRWAFIRNTSGELQSTTLQTWLSWFEDLGDIYKRQKPILTYLHTFNDGKGIVELEILFLALDRPDDVRKLKSLELTGAFLNEASELPKAVLDHLKGRVGRYPSKAFCKEAYRSSIIFDTNPPENDHWLYKMFELEMPDGHKLFKQPPGLIKDEDGGWRRNPNADNAAHLPHDYYTKLAQGQSEEFVKVFCLGEYGTVGTGRRVYPEFNSDLHAQETLEIFDNEPIYLGWDFGLTPACVVVQLIGGQVRILKEFIGNDIGVRNFAETIVLPGLKRYFPTNKVAESEADPAGVIRGEQTELTSIGQLNELNIPTQPASTNKIMSRLNAVKYFLNRMNDGRPALLIDKRNCPTLYKGFLKTYVFKRVAVPGEERFRDEPDKNSASHPHDALQYVCLKLASDNISGSKHSQFDIKSILNMAR